MRAALIVAAAALVTAAAASTAHAGKALVERKPYTVPAYDQLSDRDRYVVLMPNDRGSDGGDGVDERGGDEVDDVKALVPVARADAIKAFRKALALDPKSASARAALDRLTAKR